MAVGMSELTAQDFLTLIKNDTPFVKLHVGDPGAAGASNAATETTRKSVTFGTPGAASGGFVTMANTAQVQWTGIAGSQDATHFSLWDASTAGNFLGSGVITANAYTAGDTYTVAIGGFTLTLPVAT